MAERVNRRVDTLVNEIRVDGSRSTSPGPRPVHDRIERPASGGQTQRVQIDIRSRRGARRSRSNRSPATSARVRPRTDDPSPRNWGQLTLATITRKPEGSRAVERLVRLDRPGSPDRLASAFLEASQLISGHSRPCRAFSSVGCDAHQGLSTLRCGEHMPHPTLAGRGPAETVDHMPGRRHIMLDRGDSGVVSPDDVRAYCAAKPGACGRPAEWEDDLVFKVGAGERGKIFAFFGAGTSIGVKAATTREQADEWLVRYPDDARVSAYIGRWGGIDLARRAAFPTTSSARRSTCRMSSVLAGLPRGSRP